MMYGPIELTSCHMLRRISGFWYFSTASRHGMFLRGEVVLSFIVILFLHFLTRTSCLPNVKRSNTAVGHVVDFFRCLSDKKKEGLKLCGVSIDTEASSSLLLDI